MSHEDKKYIIISFIIVFLLVRCAFSIDKKAKL